MSQRPADKFLEPTILSRKVHLIIKRCAETGTLWTVGKEGEGVYGLQFQRQKYC